MGFPGGCLCGPAGRRTGRRGGSRDPLAAAHCRVPHPRTGRWVFFERRGARRRRGRPRSSGRPDDPGPDRASPQRRRSTPRGRDEPGPGAWTIMPSPTCRPTCRSSSKKRTRSPGSMPASVTGVPASACWCAVRGSVTPAARQRDLGEAGAVVLSPARSPPDTRLPDLRPGERDGVAARRARGDSGAAAGPGRGRGGSGGGGGGGEGSGAGERGEGSVSVSGARDPVSVRGLRGPVPVRG